MNTYLMNTLAQSTTKQYKSAYNSYLEFCNTHQITHNALNFENNLMLFATKLAASSSYSNIKKHMAAVKHHSILNSTIVSTLPLPKLYLLLRGIKRTKGLANKKALRKPITPHLLLKLYRYLQSSQYNINDQRMLWAAFTTAFFGFLRASEFVANTTTTFQPSNTLLFSDVSIRTNMAHINIKASKTDPFGYGCTIRLTTVPSVLCPVSALRHHLATHPSCAGPLFMFSNGTYLTRRRLNALLKLALPSPITEPISTHSFRIGAATTAAASGAPTHVIQQLGRWNSDCFKLYTRLMDSTITTIAIRMAKNNLSTIPPWDPDCC